jgi:Flp pilus assembly protein TadD
VRIRDLAGVTLACVDTVNHALALRALALSQRGLRFARTVLLTDAVPADVETPAGIDVESIAPLASRDDYSRFVLKSLVRHVDTDHVLLIQWDGYVVNPAAFDPAFLECDYVGAKWYWFDDGMRVGNGGFSLRSRKLLKALEDSRIELAEAEDITIGRAYRPLLEREFGIRYASEALADRFAFEAAYPAGLPFGFHGLYNFCRVVPAAELATLAAGFSDAIARSIQLGQLLRNCIALAQWDAAAALARRRLAAAPGDAEARALLARAEAGLARGPLVGRNDPCPCGSGKRYKQCHGALDTATTASATGIGEASAPPAGAAAPASASAATLAQQGLAAHQRGDLDAAERAYRAALAREPEQPLALHYLGVVLHQRGGHADALPLLERTAALAAHEPEFHNNLGLVLAALDRNEEAVAAYRRALARKPDHATAWNNLGLALQAMNRLPEAVDAFRGALAHSPAFAQAHWNLALALLAQGEYAEGFREYEWRLHVPDLGGRARRLPVRRWQGEDLRDKTLLLTAEQGIGDALQFVRFASRVADQGAHVIVQARGELRPLLATAPGVAATIGSDDDVSSFDLELPLLSLPHVLGLADPTAGATSRYLQSDPERRAAIASQLPPRDPATTRIGVAWAGAPHHRNDRRRSLPVEALTSLFALPGTRWHSLQKGSAASQLAQVAEAGDVVPLDPNADLVHTAALVDLLDAVVTVDTSIAHLAGALGKPVFVLLPFAPDWRWGVGGEHCGWYPSARLFRQPSAGDWASAVASLRDALSAR